MKTGSSPRPIKYVSTHSLLINLLAFLAGRFSSSFDVVDNVLGGGGCSSWRGTPDNDDNRVDPIWDSVPL